MAEDHAAIDAAKATADADALATANAGKTPEQIAAETLAATEKATADKVVADAKAAADAAAEKTGLVPEKYELVLPTGSKADPAIVERTAAKARELGLTNEAGQKLLDQVVEETKGAGESAVASFLEGFKFGAPEFVKRDTEWKAALLADPEFGAGKPEQFGNMTELAQQGMKKLCTPAEIELIKSTGMGSNPTFAKIMARAGKSMSEGSLVLGDRNVGAKPKSDAQILYAEHYDEQGNPK